MNVILTYMWILFTCWQIDLTDVLESCVRKNLCLSTDGILKVSPAWRNASFTLKYYSDALFDFPHWFGFSKRSFKVSLKKVSFSSCCFVCTQCLTFAWLHLYQWQLRATWAARDWFESGGHRLCLLMDSVPARTFLELQTNGCSDGLPAEGPVYLLGMQEIA